LSVKLQVFEGHLDLLIHLINKNKMDIFDIPIVEITRQYMEYLDEMKSRDMEVISEFLVMAATLLRIKSQMLLPKEVVDEREVDPRAELVERLLEYNMYKYTATQLRDMLVDADKLVFKANTIPEDAKDVKEEVCVGDLLQGVTLGRMYGIFQEMMKKREDKIDVVHGKFGRIEKEDVNLAVVFRRVQEYGLKHRKFYLKDFLMKQRGKMEVIVSFLCILELIKRGNMRVEQKEIYGDIEIHYISDGITEDMMAADAILY